MNDHHDTDGPVELEATECLNYHPGLDGCRGPVEYRTTSDRHDGRAFPRCLHHWEARERQSAHNLELMSPSPAAWFDPAYAGESWDEEE